MSKQTDLINIPDAITVDGSNVGIGTSSPNASFKATLSGLFGLRIQSADTNNSALNIGCDTNSGVSFIDSTKTGTGTFLPLRFATADVERMRIDSSGNVGIGTISPTQTLVVSESSTPTIQIKDGAASGTRVSGRLHIGETDTLGVSIENSTSAYNDNCAMVFKTSPPAGTITERMRIDASGRVTMPYQPAFWAFSSTFATTGNYPFTNFSISGAGKFNTGNHLNLTSGVFTAPLAGKYQFNGAFHSSSSSTTARRIGRFELNGNSLGEFAESSAQFADIGASIIVNMSANDTMKLITHPLNFTEADFSGFLIG